MLGSDPWKKMSTLPSARHEMTMKGVLSRVAARGSCENGFRNSDQPQTDAVVHSQDLIVRAQAELSAGIDRLRTRCALLNNFPVVLP